MRKNTTRFCITVLSAIFLFITSCNKEASPKNNAIQINSISPTSAGVGDTVTLYGKNLSLNTSDINISINNRPLSIISASADSLKFIIPANTGSGQVIVTMNGQTYSSISFTYELKAIVTTIAGTGIVGNTDGQGSQSTFYCPWGITADVNGDLYIADTYNGLIRKISASDNNVSSIGSFPAPYNITLDTKTHSLYVTDYNKHVAKVTPDGNVSTIYTDDTMPLTGIAFRPDGNLFISNNNLGTIIKIDTNGQNKTVFATGLITPRNIIFDANAVMYVPAYNVNLSSSIINRIDNSGNISMVAQDNQFQGWEIAVDSTGNFYEADHFNNLIRRIDKTGNVTVIAGNGIATDVDGVGVLASFDGPQGITIDSKGNLYVTTFNYNDNTGNKVRKITFQ